MLVDERFGDAGATVVIEDCLVGEELSLLYMTDGVNALPLIPSQDHKPIGEGDTGPNTGGMGAYAPVSIADDALVGRVTEEVIMPTLHALRTEGRTFRGVLYCGLIIADGDPFVIEFNCRFGDPETQAVLPLLRSDLAVAMKACAEGDLCQVPIEWTDEASVTVVMASKGYPETPTDPAVIHGLGSVADAGVTVFHAGTELADGEVLAIGGRVLAVTAIAPELSQAAELAHAAVARLDFTGSQHRIDIARTTAEGPR